MNKKTEALSDAIGGINDELLYRAQSVREKKPAGRKLHYVRWTAAAAACFVFGLLLGKLPLSDIGSMQGTITDFTDVSGWVFVDDGKPLTGVQENLRGWEDYRFTFDTDGELQTVEQRTETGWQPVWQSDKTG